MGKDPSLFIKETFLQRDKYSEKWCVGKGEGNPN